MAASQHDFSPEEQHHHPRLQLNEAIHQPVRLSLMALLAKAKRADFAFLRDQLELGDSNLSRHLTALEELGYIEIEKVFEKKRARTWVTLSPTGRQALEDHIRILRQIVEQPLDLPEN
ncbi:winged helix-turn-helix domain-containing protein [Dictyobacter kobayashii]|uniref:Transcriptional regulator n=1 Tax=Dictyobacter kobayashii TaxID=2014872 RepID=A0A402AYR6_9CHLR|nr:transcriptional regulator [Dictyobacter kobayashii]GCE24228.1 transcriptional regulator [Dictyobacter kobayashii]